MEENGRNEGATVYSGGAANESNRGRGDREKRVAYESLTSSPSLAVLCVLLSFSSPLLSSCSVSCGRLRQPQPLVRLAGEQQQQRRREAHFHPRPHQQQGGGDTLIRTTSSVAMSWFAHIGAKALRFEVRTTARRGRGNSGRRSGAWARVAAIHSILIPLLCFRVHPAAVAMCRWSCWCRRCATRICLQRCTSSGSGRTESRAPKPVSWIEREKERRRRTSRDVDDSLLILLSLSCVSLPLLQCPAKRACTISSTWTAIPPSLSRRSNSCAPCT